MRLFHKNGFMKSMLRTLFLCLTLIGFSTDHAAAQCSAAPATYSGTCAELQNYLNSFQATLNTQWSGQKSAVNFSGEMLAADANRGLTALLDPRTFNAVLMELNGYAEVGTQAITVAIGFPILYQPFYTFKGNNPGDYASVLSFYQRVVNEAHKRGLKVIVETSVMFPTYATDLPLAAFARSRAATPQPISLRAQPSPAGGTNPPKSVT